MFGPCPAFSGQPSSTTVSSDNSSLACADAVALGYRLQRRVRRLGMTLPDACRMEGIAPKEGLAAIRFANADADDRLDSGTPGLPCTLDVARERLG